MQIDIQLVPAPPVPDTLSNRTIVVIDVLRATSVMVHALSQGATEIVPVTHVEEAFDLAKTFPPATTLLGGERGSQRVEGFHLGNSPREYAAQRIKGKRLILTTTNGTRALRAVASGNTVLVGSFLNLGAVAQKCFEVKQDLLLFPSGDQGMFSLEDTVCAGMLIDRMLKKDAPWIELNDASRASLMLSQRFETNLVEALRLSRHGQELIGLGLKEDLAFCSQTDVTDIVPTFRDGVIRRS